MAQPNHTRRPSVGASVTAAMPVAHHPLMDDNRAVAPVASLDRPLPPPTPSAEASTSGMQAAPSGTISSQPSHTPQSRTQATPLPAVQERAEDQALQIRGHLLRAAWLRFRGLGRGQRWLLVFRLLLSFLQVVPPIVILCLPTSLGNSPGPNGTECDPEPMFVFLALHSVRVVASIPLDFYLALSPHRSSRQRRPGAAGQAERERTRTIGNLNLDRKAAKLADLLAFVHVILFAVGNYSVWTRTDCSSAPADSVPLFWTAFAVLCISYFFIIVIVTLTFLVVFFLPALLVVLRTLGLTHRLPTAAIRPETGKINKEDVEQVTQLVYYIAEREGTLAESQDQSGPEPVSEGIGRPEGGSHQVMAPVEDVKSPNTNLSTTLVEGPSVNSPQPAPPRRWWRPVAAILPWHSRRRPAVATVHEARNATASSAPTLSEETSTKGRLKYPLHPLPAHRSTCPICLCDFEMPSAALDTETEGQDGEGETRKDASAVQAGQVTRAEESGAAGVEEPEPLRLLPCGHVFHRSCVDEWLTTVSGRCPVCQRPVLPTEAAEDAADGHERGEGAEPVP
ncbi:unnamed protein product [Parajaminaea phylloscopi]